MQEGGLWHNSMVSLCWGSICSTTMLGDSIRVRGTSRKACTVMPAQTPQVPEQISLVLRSKKVGGCVTRRGRAGDRWISFWEWERTKICDVLACHIISLLLGKISQDRSTQTCTNDLLDAGPRRPIAMTGSFPRQRINVLLP